MQSRKIFHGAYYDFKSLEKRTQERVQAKLDGKAHASSLLLK